MGYMVEDRFIQKTLFAQILATNRIDYKFDSKVTEHYQQGGYISVQLDDGQKLRTRLVVGADGRNSNIAKRAKI